VSAAAAVLSVGVVAALHARLAQPPGDLRSSRESSVDLMGKRGAMAEESEKQRLNRELIELLNELRVVLPGVQVLFAFLLTIPFARGFPDLDRLDRDVYFGALLAAVASSILLIAPSAYHRVLFRHHDKEYVIEMATRMALVGTFALAVSISCAVFVIADFVFGGVAAGVVGALVTIMSVTFWFLLPLRRRARLDRLGEHGAEN
jgi:hypothetical protein